jgi:hypothetical protein
MDLYIFLYLLKIVFSIFLFFVGFLSGFYEMGVKGNWFGLILVVAGFFALAWGFNPN